MRHARPNDFLIVTARTWLAFAALAVLWGIPYFLIKVAVPEISPLLIAFARVTLAAAVLLPIAWWRGGFRSLSSHKTALCAFALVEFVMPFAAISLGERWIDSSLAGILIATVPLWVALLSRFFGLHEPLGRWRVMGLVVGFVGVLTLLGLGTVAGPQGWAGVGCLLAAALGYGTGPLIIQRHLRGLDAVGPLAASLGVASALLLVPAMSVLPSRLPSSDALWSVAVLGVVCTAAAMLLMFYLVEHAGAARASLITYFNPMVAALLGVWLLDERLGTGGVAAFALILAGSWVASRGSRPPTAPRRAASHS
jgi:drug/metabolite transporter (DMT)-like permease